MQECIHFDGKECRNAESNYYGSYGNNCVNCENKEVDNMKEKIKIVDCYGTDADGFKTYVAQAYELNLELIIAYKDINKPHINVDIKNAERVDRYLQSLGYYSEALYVDMNVLQGCDTYTIDIYFEEKGRKWLKDMLLNYINRTKEKCINLLDELNKRELSQKDINILCEDFCCGYELFNCQLFKFIPQYIEEFDDLVKLLDKYNDDNEDKITSAIYFMHKNKNKFDDEKKIFKGGYWFYMDGVNWEDWACNQDEIIWMLKWKVEEDMTEEEQKDYLEVIETVL